MCSGIPAAAHGLPPAHHRVNNPADCRAMAYQLHGLFEGNYPLFWALINDDREKLALIFEFFCATRKLLIAAPDRLMGLLHQRVAARSAGGPPPIPFGFEVVIEHFAKEQIKEYRKLGALGAPAFELFASAALTTRRQYLREMSAVGQASIDLPEPDGPAFFYWVEFAFLAAYAGHDPNEWKELIRILLRAQKIYALCYGKPVKGRIPAGTKFSSYRPENFLAIHPDEARLIPYPASRRFDELEVEATACVAFTFPGGVS
jgi:hypothetical protein